MGNVLVSQPFCSSNFTHSACPKLHALWNAVQPVVVSAALIKGM